LNVAPGQAASEDAVEDMRARCRIRMAQRHRLRDTVSGDTDLGDPLTSWTLTWSFGAGQTVTQAWNTSLTQSGAAVNAKNVSYNGSVATNGTASFGFNGSWTGS
jgi:cellulase/cellobiase CelA1